MNKKSRVVDEKVHIQEQKATNYRIPAKHKMFCKRWIISNKNLDGNGFQRLVFLCVENVIF
jgi:hypothetical protein